MVCLALSACSATAEVHSTASDLAACADGLAHTVTARDGGVYRLVPLASVWEAQMMRLYELLSEFPTHDFVPEDDWFQTLTTDYDLSRGVADLSWALVDVQGRLEGVAVAQNSPYDDEPSVIFLNYFVVGTRAEVATTRRKGLGTALLYQTMQHAFARGKTAAVWGCRPDAAPALSLYRSLGCTETDEFDDEDRPYAHFECSVGAMTARLADHLNRAGVDVRPEL